MTVLEISGQTVPPHGGAVPGSSDGPASRRSPGFWRRFRTKPLGMAGLALA